MILENRLGVDVREGRKSLSEAFSRKVEEKGGDRRGH
jgi:hypothetical protein